jgi:group II intron reverse transcriptase/maturase
MAKTGKKRQLGIPTVSDRIAQQVITEYLEPRLEQEFSNHSYGYRPGRNAHQALAEVQKHVRQYAWVIDMDIKSFFDNVPHELLMKALEKHVSEKWVLLYIQRWLEAPIEDEAGNINYREGRGITQGGVISPLLANLFLHYAFDKWMEKYHSSSPFVRYADDMVIHCKWKSKANHLIGAIQARFAQCGLEIHETKTKIVYCKNSKRRNKSKEMQFDFLGYTFKPRTTRTRKGEKFLSFSCGMSQKRITKITKELRLSKLHRRTQSSLSDIADIYNARIRGWINYYGKFRWYEMRKLFRSFNARLIKWASNRYKRFNKSRVKAQRWLRELAEKFPNTFYHWRYSIFRTA